MNKELARIGDRLDKVERNMDQLHAEIAKLVRAIQEACKEYDDADVIPRHFRNPKKRRRKSLIYDHSNQENSE